MEQMIIVLTLLTRSMAALTLFIMLFIYAISAVATVL